MEEQKINKKITYGIVAVLLIVLITIGATYAYFSAQAETDVQTVTTGTLTMGFETGDTLNLTGLIPIEDSEIKSKAAEIPFSITNTGNQHMNITIKLKDITIADDLKDVDFRWGLYNADTDVGISFGIFKYAETGGEEIIYRDSIIDAGSPKKNYILRIWIHDDGAEQNYMQGETFSAKIDVTGTAIEYTDESCFYFDETTGTITGYDIMSDEEGDIIYDNKSRPVSASGGKCPSDVVIPKEIDDVAVTKIGQFAFDADNSSVDLTHVIIPDSVTEIRLGAFDAWGENINLTHITIPESVTKIGDNAFDGNPLSTVILPGSVTEFGDYAFNGNPLSTLILPGSVTTVGYEAFVGIPLSELILMEGITSIESRAFLSSDFTTIELPSSVMVITVIGENNFDGSPFISCDNLQEIILRGKTEVPDTFATDWNCTEWDYSTQSCAKYANVVYRP